MGKRIVLFLMCLLVVIGHLSAQVTKMSGIVLSKDDGLPIVGASVLIQGTTHGTITDVDGKFVLDNIKPTDKKVMVSFIGMKTQVVDVKSFVKVVLVTESEMMDEVMVVAYGTAKRSAFTGSASVVNAEKLSKRQTTNVVQALAGQVAGLQMTSGSGQPGGDAPTLIIRGIGSINADNDPLIIVDGMPYEGGWNNINPSDVESGFESLVSNAYSTLRDVYAVSSYTTYFNAGTDMYADGRNYINDELHEYETLNPENSVMKELYTACYKGIRAAYAIKHYAADAVIDENLRSRRVDEARVLAANYYYILVNTFGGVPLMKDYVADVQTGYPKSSVVDVYTYIIEELENVIAAGAMEKSTALDGGGRISIESARALLAKTYLAAAWDLDKKDYFAKAAQVADDVIANRALVTPFEDLWRADCSGDDNEEFIWDVEYDYATAANTVSGGHPWSSFYCNHMGGQEDHGKGSTSAFIATLHALQCFEKGDIRYGVTFMKELPDIVTASAYWYWDWYKNGGTFIGIPLKRYYPAWYETEEDIDAWKALDPENRKNTWILPMSDHTRDPQEYMPGEIDYEEFVTYSYGGAPCRKFDDSNTASYSNKTDYRDVHIITLPEIYLVAAEAYLKAGDKGNALLRLNEVRRRARLDAVTEINVDVILKERACELFGQGSRWIDLRRTQKLVEYNDLYNPQIKGRAAQMIGKKLLRPIPQAAIDANELMSAEDQNPGY